MLWRTGVFRLLLGLGALALTLAGAFAVFMAQIPTWGASADEVARGLPGDELAPLPLLNWTNAIDIAAPADQVWPWVAQLGDTRGGFYSYTFIEDRVGVLTGASGYAVNYENAGRLHPEWQTPQPGAAIIQGVLKVRAVEPGRYLLADAIDPAAMQWTWLWQLDPAGPDHTRLIVRFRLQRPAAGANPVLTAAMMAGGFVMQQRMLHGLKLRAEGGAEPAWLEAAEIALWLATLVIGLAAGGLYLFRADWPWPLALALSAAAALVALTFIQPELWVRAAVNVLLTAGLVLAGSRPALAAAPRRAESLGV